MTHKNKIIYGLNVEDIQTVAKEVLDRELSDTEIDKITDRIANNIHWFETIESAIGDNITA